MNFLIFGLFYYRPVTLVDEQGIRVEIDSVSDAVQSFTKLHHLYFPQYALGKVALCDV
jgi:hypothetical protein